MTRLRATARLQLHAGFNFDAAAAQLRYYAALGVSHLYLSPISAAGRVDAIVAMHGPWHRSAD
ncbi:hypothetical protein, partial [Chromobacterium amazonense]|uniref:hypothetical protein n=1 Tax=Chromobacterium amazonense TaxID=1382803 RepID=UPI0031F6F161